MRWIWSALLALCLLALFVGTGMAEAAAPAEGASTEEAAEAAEDVAGEDPVTEVFDWISDMTGAEAVDEEGGASGLEFGDTMELDRMGEVPRARFAVRNASDRAIAGYWVLVYGTDEAGTVIYGHDDGGWWTEGELPPGDAGFTEYVELPEDERIACLHTLVQAVAYADGGEWELDTSDPQEAASRGLVADWTVE